MRDIEKGQDHQVRMVLDMILAVQPDIIHLTRFDYDYGHVALRRFNDQLSRSGLILPFVYADIPNSGLPTGIDLDGDGRKGGPGDSIGYGSFSGQGGMAILSRFPINYNSVRNLSGETWPLTETELIRLSSVGHWDVPVQVPGWSHPIHLLAYHAGTPAFDDPTGRNRRRNRQENLLWLDYLDGKYGGPVPQSAYVVLGDTNLDPNDGAGDRQVMAEILADLRFIDPLPKSSGAINASEVQGGPNARHRGDPALDTADFRDAGGPGNLRVDYVLPSADLTVLDSGVFWPAKDEHGYRIISERERAISWHGLVWVDIAK